MQASSVSLAFAALVVVWLAAQLWLLTRQIRHVAQHRDRVPDAFASTVSLATHQRSADYTMAKARLALLSTGFAAVVLLGWTLLGGLDLLNTQLRDAVQPRWGDMAYQLALLSSFVLIGATLELPFDLYATFVVEQRFGFNRMTPGLFVADLLKGLLLAAVIGLPLAALILWIMGALGASWWFWAWVAWVGFNLVLLVLYPTVIAPLFNRFEPLPDEALTAIDEAWTEVGGVAPAYNR